MLSPSPHSMLSLNWSTFIPATLFYLHFYQATVNGGERGLQKNPEYVIQSDLKDKTPYSPNEFVHDCRYKGHSFRIGAASHAGLH